MNKKGLELLTSCSSGYETSSEKFLYSLYIIWTILMMQCEAVFELLQKLHLRIHGIINYSYSICPFISEKCGKTWKKLQKNEYLENEKSFLD